MDVAPDGVGLVQLQQALNLSNFGEIGLRIDARQRPRRAVLFATEARLFAAFRVHRRAGAEIAFYGNEVFGRHYRHRHRVRLQAEKIFQFPSEVDLRFRNLRVALDHGDRVIRALAGAIATTDAGLRIDVYLPQFIATNGSGRATGQAFRVGAVHTDFRRQNT